MTNESISFRAARPGDGRTIARLCTAVQSARTLPLTVWSSPRAYVWVDDLLAGAQPELGIEYYVLESNDEIEGAVCVRPVDSHIFFDNVFVAPRLRRLQMSAPFIRWACETFNQKHRFTTAAWDVWAHERALIAWYKQVCGVEQYRKNWWSIEPPGGSDTSGITGVDSALKQYERYGFSTICVKTNHRSYTVGLLSSSAFRVTDGRAIEDPELLAALGALDPERKVQIACTPEQTPPGVEPTATTIRMKAPVTEFLAALTRYTPGRERSK